MPAPFSPERPRWSARLTDVSLEALVPTTLNAPQDPQDGGFRLNGRRVLFILLATFGVVFAVNGYMVWRAIGSYPGVVTESSFRDGQRFNAEIAAARAQADRAWQVEAEALRGDDGVARVTLVGHDRDGKPLSGVTFRARLEHPADRARDKQIALAPVAGTSDRWEGSVGETAAGKWGLVIEGDGAAGRLFLSQNTVFFK